MTNSSHDSFFHQFFVLHVLLWACVMVRFLNFQFMKSSWEWQNNKVKHSFPSGPLAVLSQYDGAERRRLHLVSEPAVGIETYRCGKEREEEDVRTSSNCLQFRPGGLGGRHWYKIEKLLFCISSDKKWPSVQLNWCTVKVKCEALNDTSFAHMSDNAYCESSWTAPHDALWVITPFVSSHSLFPVFSVGASAMRRNNALLLSHSHMKPFCLGHPLCLSLLFDRLITSKKREGERCFLFLFLCFEREAGGEGRDIWKS